MWAEQELVVGNSQEKLCIKIHVSKNGGMKCGRQSIDGLCVLPQRMHKRLFNVNVCRGEGDGMSGRFWWMLD